MNSYVTQSFTSHGVHLLHYLQNQVPSALIHTSKLLAVLSHDVQAISLKEMGAVTDLSDYLEILTNVYFPFFNILISLFIAIRTSKPSNRAAADSTSFYRPPSPSFIKI